MSNKNFRIKLKKFEIFGFKREITNAWVDFSENDLSIIYANNGIGKTSFLKLIHAFLIKDTSILKENKVKKIICSYSITHTESIKDGLFEEVEEYNDLFEIDELFQQPEAKDYDCTLEEINGEWSLSGSDIIFRSRSILLGVDRGVSTQINNLSPSLIFDFFHRYRVINKNRSNLINFGNFNDSNLREFSSEMAEYFRRRQRISNVNADLNFSIDHLAPQSVKIDTIEGMIARNYEDAKSVISSKIENALFDTLSGALNNDQSFSSFIESSEKTQILTKIVKNKQRILDALEGIDSVFKETITEKLENLDESNLNTDAFSNVLTILLNNINNQFDLENTLLENLNILIDSFNSHLIKGKKLTISNGVRIEIGKENHSISYLSSGERHILTLLCLVLFGTKNRDFLIIDEPEISLNSSWQRNLMSLFLKLAPETQIIVASHSPAIAAAHRSSLTGLKIN